MTGAVLSRRAEEVRAGPGRSVATHRHAHGAAVELNRPDIWQPRAAQPSVPKAVQVPYAQLGLAELESQAKPSQSEDAQAG